MSGKTARQAASPRKVASSSVSVIREMRPRLGRLATSLAISTASAWVSECSEASKQADAGERFGLDFGRFPFAGDGRFQEVADGLVAAEFGQHVEGGAADFDFVARQALGEEQLGGIERGKGFELLDGFQAVGAFAAKLGGEVRFGRFEFGGDIAVLGGGKTGAGP